LLDVHIENIRSLQRNSNYKMTACHPSAHHLSALERDVQMVRAGLDF
jgi:hypothetical protein